ncbi:MAG: lasso peptide biosynthesis protein [Alphaproteobacteria bacterium]|nr:lasso peptide biosynthesis protein [Alphaproteobacteria bacterium]MCB9699793.1 lasso peptide biosynthesis protein [Alphaproteobacteria bacterium]
MARADWMFAARVGLATTAAAALLRVAGLPSVVRVMGRRSGWPAELPDPVRMARITDRVLSLDLGPLRPNCVLRSLVLYRYLPRDRTVLRFGLRPGVRPADGHAWIERDDQPFAEPTDPRPIYDVTWSWPA